VPACVDEDGVHPQRNTETFAEVEVGIDNPRWDGTTFLLRAGKGPESTAQGSDRALAYRSRGSVRRRPPLLSGDSTLSILGDEAELCWQIVTPTIGAWHDNQAGMRRGERRAVDSVNSRSIGAGLRVPGSSAS
jgi:glucose-6-phosphate 1-dehydrogenase